MKPATGALLRMIGYLVEIICLAMWLKLDSDGKLVAGIPLRTLLLGGVFCGAAMIFASHLVKKTVPVRKPPRDFLNR